MSWHMFWHIEVIIIANFCGWEIGEEIRKHRRRKNAKKQKV